MVVYSLASSVRNCTSYFCLCFLALLLYVVNAIVYWSIRQQLHRQSAVQLLSVFGSAPYSIQSQIKGFASICKAFIRDLSSIDARLCQPEARLQIVREEVTPQHFST